ncbi:unnamed protein product [Agarophyton chilense]
MTKQASNRSNPNAGFKGKTDSTYRQSSSESTPFLGDSVQQTENAFACLSGLRPPNMSHRPPHFSEKTDALWVVTLREVAFHFSKIGEAINQCANETEKLVQSHECTQVCKQEGNSSPSIINHSYRDRINGNLQPIAQCSNGCTANQSQNEQLGSSVIANQPGNSGSRIASRCIRPPLYPDSFAAGQQNHTANAAFNLKRHPPLSVSELEHRTRQPLQVVSLERAENVRPYAYPRFPRPHKRIRVNWTEEENSVFFETIKKNSSKDEQTVLREIVAALGGSRNWVQCKGHFRNLFAVGRITREKGELKSWVVHEEIEDNKEEDSKAPTSTSKTESHGTHSKSFAGPDPSTCSSNDDVNVKIMNCVDSEVQGLEAKQKTDMNNAHAEICNGHVNRSASIDRLMNPTTDHNERRVRNAQRTQNEINKEHGQSEHHVLFAKNGKTTTKAYVTSQSRNQSGRRDLDISRVRETAIFLSRQAAAKAAYEKSNCEPVEDRGLRP